MQQLCGHVEAAADESHSDQTITLPENVEEDAALICAFNQPWGAFDGSINVVGFDISEPEP
jgi:hypothetical protein